MDKSKLLTIYFYVFGAGNIITSFVLPVFFGDVLLWSPRNLPTDLMVGSLYMAMGIVMILIAKSPKKHTGLIDFIIIANILHAMVMIIYAQKPAHIFFDAGLIAMMGIVPLVLYPWPLRKFLRYDDESIA